MSKQKAKPAPKATAPVEPVAPVETPDPAAPVPVATRGPRGVLESAAITVLVAENPKRADSKAHFVFSHYKKGMTVGAFCDAVGKEATPNLVYDAAHGFISIEGYEPGKKFVPKAKAPKAAKEPKAPRTPKGGKVKAEPLPDPDEALEVTEETVDD